MLNDLELDKLKELKANIEKNITEERLKRLVLKNIKFLLEFARENPTKEIKTKDGDFLICVETDKIYTNYKELIEYSDADDFREEFKCTKEGICTVIEPVFKDLKINYAISHKATVEEEPYSIIVHFGKLNQSISITTSRLK